MPTPALNLIAIGVFVFTLMSLVGPLLHWSPAIPATLVASVLGLVTLDTVGLKGQGMSIVLDWMAGRSVAHRERVTRHEAGHFLVAYLLDIPITGYTLSAWEAFRQGKGGQGGVSYDSSVLEAHWQQGQLPVSLFERYGTVWMAGVAAEVLSYGQADGGEDDRAQLQLAWRLLGRSPEEGQQQERWATFRARTFIQDNWNAYEALVRAMEQRASVEECCEAMKPFL